MKIFSADRQLKIDLTKFSTGQVDMTFVTAV